MAGPLLFIGDSITDAGRRDDPEGLGTGYVRLIVDELRGRGDERPVVNTGIGGDRVRDLRARWQPDALDHAPELLSIYVGINDTWRRYDHDDPTSLEHFAADYRVLLERARAAGVRDIVLVQPFALHVLPGQDGWGEDLDPKRAAIDALGDEFDAVVVPLHDRMTQAAAESGDAHLAWDGVHPTDAGSAVIARAWLDSAATLLGK